MHALNLWVPRELVEALSDALMFEHEALSVSVEDADAGSAEEQALFGEPGMAVDVAWRRSSVAALFADADAVQAAANAVLHEDRATDLSFQSITLVPDADWVRLTQAQFDPVEITPDFWVVPTWHKAPEQALKVLRLDPGLAFGSGTHPTTRMCLRWIARHSAEAVKDRRVLDYGCGSGILAVAAAMHGAREVDAVDIDDAAVTACADNAVLNQVRLQSGTPELACGPYDLVLANILATPLQLLAPVLGALVSPAGHIVLAGVLSRQFEWLRTAYAPHLSLEIADEIDGWILLTGQAPGTSHGMISA
jgi:ribosomal protein L11 methyltransferase